MSASENAAEDVRNVAEIRRNVAVLGDRVLVAPPEDAERRTKGGILIPATAKSVDRKGIWGETIGVGPHVRHVQSGDEVLYLPEDAIEVDVDCITDVGRFADPNQGSIVIGAMLEHIEFAGVHSGDAAMVLPPHTLSGKVIDTIREYTHAMARELKVIGLMNVQYAVKDEVVYVLEVNPRASRTVPFVAKSIGVPVAKIAAKVMAGARLADFNLAQPKLKQISVKEAVFPFARFPHVDTLLGPEMKSTGEVMGLDHDFRKAYLKSQIAAGSGLPTMGKIFVSVKNRDKRQAASLAKRLVDLGFMLVATPGTARVLERHGMAVEVIHKVADRGRLNVVDLMQRKEIALVFNTPEDGRARKDSFLIRRTAVNLGVPYYLTVDGAQAAIGAIEALLKGDLAVRSLQEYHAGR